MIEKWIVKECSFKQKEAIVNNKYSEKNFFKLEKDDGMYKVISGNVEEYIMDQL